MHQQKQRTLFFSYIICTLAALFYLYEFALQVLPSVITNQLMRDLQLDAASLGIVSAFYYYAYTPMQLPAGLLYDRFGPRKVLTIAITLCAIGALFFSLTHDMTMAAAGRFFMGIGSAFSFSGALLLISRWFPKNYFPVLSGMVQFMSAIGAISGQVLLANIAVQLGWRNSVHVLALIGIALAILVAIIVRDYPRTSINGVEPIKKVGFNNVSKVFKSKQTWLIALYSFSVWAPIATFAALWGIPFLVAADAIATHNAACYVAFVWLGVGIGSPLLGWWSEKIKSRCLPLTVVAIAGIIAMVTIIYFPYLNKILVSLGMFLLGVAGSGQSLTFSLINDETDPSYTGTAIGFNNMAIVAGGAVFQPLVGILLHNQWHGAMAHGVPLYSVVEYRSALWVLPLCYLIAAIVSSKFLRESKRFAKNSIF